MLRPYISDSAAFEPETIDVMSKAFADACIELGVFAGDDRGREIIATRIIELARGGAIDAATLRDRVLAEARLSL